MSMSLVLLISSLALIITLPNPTESVRIELRSGTSKCISEDIKTAAMSIGKYAVVNPNEPSPIPDFHKLAIRVSSPSGKSYHHGEGVDSGDFAFTATETGDYTTCFWAPERRPPATVIVDFDWRSGMAAMDWSNVAKRGHLEVMELELRKLSATVASIHDEMFYLREREDEMQKFNRSTDKRMATFSFFSLVVCASVTCLQLWHLKSFFEKRKII